MAGMALYMPTWLRVEEEDYSGYLIHAIYGRNVANAADTRLALEQVVTRFSKSNGTSSYVVQLVATGSRLLICQSMSARFRVLSGAMAS